MRWTHGDKRVVRRLCLIPRCVDGKWYWLRLLYVVQKYRVYTALDPEMRAQKVYTWNNVSWHAIMPEGIFFKKESHWLLNKSS